MGFLLLKFGLSTKSISITVYFTINCHLSHRRFLILIRKINTREFGVSIVLNMARLPKVMVLSHITG